MHVVQRIAHIIPTYNTHYTHNINIMGQIPGHSTRAHTLHRRYYIYITGKEKVE